MKNKEFHKTFLTSWFILIFKKSILNIKYKTIRYNNMFSINGKSCNKLFMLFGKGLKKPLIAPIGIALINEVILGSIGIIL